MIAKKINAAIEPVVLLIGTGLIAYGAWLAYKPAGFILGGALLIAGILFHARGE